MTNTNGSYTRLILKACKIQVFSLVPITSSLCFLWGKNFVMFWKSFAPLDAQLRFLLLTLIVSSTSWTVSKRTLVNCTKYPRHTKSEQSTLSPMASSLLSQVSVLHEQSLFSTTDHMANWVSPCSHLTVPKDHYYPTIN